MFSQQGAADTQGCKAQDITCISLCVFFSHGMEYKGTEQKFPPHPNSPSVILKAHLMQQSVHTIHGTAQLAFSVAGSVEGTIGCGHRAIAVKAPAAASAIFITTTRPSTGTAGAGGISWSTTYLEERA